MRRELLGAPPVKLPRSLSTGIKPFVPVTLSSSCRRFRKPQQNPPSRKIFVAHDVTSACPSESKNRSPNATASFESPCAKSLAPAPGVRLLATAFNRVIGLFPLLREGARKKRQQAGALQTLARRILPRVRSTLALQLYLIRVLCVVCGLFSFVFRRFLCPFPPFPRAPKLTVTRKGDTLCQKVCYPMALCFFIFFKKPVALPSTPDIFPVPFHPGEGDPDSITRRTDNCFCPTGRRIDGSAPPSC